MNMDYFCKQEKSYQKTPKYTEPSLTAFFILKWNSRNPFFKG